MVTPPASGTKGDALAKQRWIGPSTPHDGPSIIEMMNQTGLSPASKASHLHWKYWLERNDWPEARSYVLTNGTELLAHAAVIPGSCSWTTGKLRIAHLVDWASRPTAIGAGVTLLRHIGHLTEALLAVGGSADTRRILPSIGFHYHGNVAGYVRPLFPLRLLQEVSARTSRLLPRLARSIAWTLTAPHITASDWDTRKIAPTDIDLIESVLPRARNNFAVMDRTPDLFRYLIQCPIVRTELYLVEKKGLLRGYFLLTAADGQTRLSDCWVASEDPTDWQALIACAVREAKKDGQTIEMAAWSSDPLLSHGLHRNGFHRRFTLPILMRGPSNIPFETLRVQMVDNDAMYLHDRGRTLLL